jgi:thiamine pyrophosphate-dependent acetolactate synthase large subunit-like protein
MKVSEAVAETVYAEGVRKVFVVLGHGNMEACIKLGQLGAELRSARHEAAAVAMAEGYALGDARSRAHPARYSPHDGVTQLRADRGVDR